MKYQDGTEVRLGDIVDLGSGWQGVVAAVFDTRQFSHECSEQAWGYLQVGAMVECPEAGLIHYEDSEHDFDLIRRGDDQGGHAR